MSEVIINEHSVAISIDDDSYKEKEFDAAAEVVYELDLDVVDADDELVVLFLVLFAQHLIDAVGLGAGIIDPLERPLLGSRAFGGPDFDLCEPALRLIAFIPEDVFGSRRVGRVARSLPQFVASRDEALSPGIARPKGVQAVDDDRYLGEGLFNGTGLVLAHRASVPARRRS